MKCIVVCLVKGREKFNEMFDDFDSAFNFAREKTEKDGLISVVLYFDDNSKTWRTKVKLFPPESC